LGTLRNWSPALVPFLVSRALIFLIILMVSQTQIFKHMAWEGEVISPHVELGSKELFSNLKRIVTSGDARWYIGIAEEGYDFSNLEISKMRNWVFFPLLPLLIKLLSPIVGSSALAGLIISNLCFLLFLKVLEEICKEERFESLQTERVLWLTAFFPVSYFYSMPITESLFVLFFALSYLNLKRRNFLLASFTLAITVATRPTGVLILPAFLLALWLNSNLTVKRFFTFFLPSGIILLGLLSFYFLNTGDPLAFIHNQFFWDRNGSPLTLLRELATNPGVLMTGWNFIMLSFFTVVVGVAAIFHFLKRKEFDFAVMILFPFAAMLNTGTLLAVTRISMPLFPIIFFVSSKMTKPWIEKTVYIIFAMLLGIMTLLFALHVTPAMA
jgi:hypothetical protein